MYSKLEITGKIKVMTGLHIGGSKEFSAIGAVDSPVMRDTYSNMPFIPGSSLKGKLRFLLQEKYGKKARDEKTNHNDDDLRVKRLFGSSNDKNNEKPIKSRLYFSDSFISNEKDLNKMGIEQITEVKFENTINRFTAIANPRQIERVIRGTEFDMSVIYNADSQEDLREDIKNLKEAFELLEYDYLGGNGSRGYGRVKIENLELNQAFGDLENQDIEELKKIIGEI
ncbi:CRISPR type III-A/MTUBE-associated RAMP protein Csm3 [Peptoniphilus harei]|uniref:type III-A CRISPR-associated RAMP protein Csm3 n=1 Tax=Peptoniphilus harei TaxID=54005 RepID=UPI000F708586|nr:type III-A CRISPR-associated RAMP protein Csm3 [Peptoniphilus harei]QQE47565.1 type III-A CRISPR-associated RAMP protein Csm3 [Peptoniphilus harei]VEJ33866.1 CRISPR type III-A/MTUBE-associated RAMP protein Csm3 [Peptoniphilus harei]